MYFTKHEKEVKHKLSQDKTTEMDAPNCDQKRLFIMRNITYYSWRHINIK